MSANAISKLQQAGLSVDTGSAQKQLCFRTHIRNCLSADHFINIDALHKMFLIFYAKPQRADLS